MAIRKKGWLDDFFSPGILFLETKVPFRKAENPAGVSGQIAS
jgi:hypothetical protein